MNIKTLFTYSKNFALSTFAPLTCVICGKECSRFSSFPLCKHCVSKLSELQEAKGKTCSICGKEIFSENKVCMRCRKTIFCFDKVVSIFDYYGIVRDMLLAYKSKNRRSLALYFAQKIAVIINKEYPSYVVVPVPPRPGKITKKGWDQVDTVARILEKTYKIRICRCLKRDKGLEQKSLDLEGRKKNLQGKVHLIKKLDASVDVLIFDDIMTSGITLSECASVIKKNGNKNVCAITIARD